MIFNLSLKSIKSRKFISMASILSIALSVTLLLGIEKIKNGAKDSFVNTISDTDLIVGAKGGSLQLLLYSVFHMGQGIDNLYYEHYQKVAAHPSIAWTVPLSFGDSYKGYRVVGTNEAFVEHYKYANKQDLKLIAGENLKNLFDVVLGNEVATKFNIKVGDKIILSHGVSNIGLNNHDKSPFTITGIIGKTNTAVDKGVYITLEGLEAMHFGWENGVPSDDNKTDYSKLKREDVTIKQVTSFLVRTKNKIHMLYLQRYIQKFEEYPMMAIMPAVTLAELWDTLSYVEVALKIISYCVLIVSVLCILITIYSTLNERKREMSILRSIGASPFQIGSLFVVESLFLVFTGILIGVFNIYVLQAVVAPILSKTTSLYLPISGLNLSDFISLGLILGLTLIVAFIPAIKAYKYSIHETL